MKTPCRLPRTYFSIFAIITWVVLALDLAAPTPTTAAPSAGIPWPTYPAYFATTTPLTDAPLGIPTFQWTGVEGTSVYRLQVDNEAGFNPPIHLSILTSNTTYTPLEMSNILFRDGVWYWRVQVMEPEQGPWSPVQQFTKDWTTGGSNAPVLAYPAEGAVLSFFDAPGFSWSPVLGASSYLFQIAAAADFSNVLVAEKTLATSIQIPTRLANGPYAWRVIPLDFAEHLGAPSGVRTFVLAYGSHAQHQVPLLLEPGDGSLPVFTPTFRWTAVDGAQQYQLEITPDQTCDFTHGGALQIETSQTSYTPTATLPDYQAYCWHVRAMSGPVAGEWSETWHFEKNWQIQPVLLTPTNYYQTGSYPLYSWTPVPGAASYRIQIAKNPGFNPIFEQAVTANTTFAPQSGYSSDSYYYWRVQPLDGSGRAGAFSQVSSFQSMAESLAPRLAYPLYYYAVDEDNGLWLNPHEDRTVAQPVFIWQRVLSPTGGVYPAAYRIQVDDSYYFTSVDWEYDTENTVVTPLASDDFTPLANHDYFWRVCILPALGGPCETNPDSGLPWWSQVWKARFDPAVGLSPTQGQAPELLRPTHGQEIVEATPLLEWRPLQGATQYQVEISRDPAFTGPAVVTATVTLPAFAPPTSLAQRRLGRLDFGTFYWRVRGYVGTSWTEWSEPWRFQIAAQSEWRLVRMPGDPLNRLQIGEDSSSDVPAPFNLVKLYGSQSNTHWFFGFNANLTGADITYVFYLDLDHVDGSGAPAPPERSYTISTVPGHRPEYAIYIDKVGAAVSDTNTWLYAWNGASWGFGQQLADIGGDVYSEGNYVELLLPNQVIGMNQNTSSASVMLLSINPDTGWVVDSVPGDPSAPGTGELSRFSAISEHMNLIMPPAPFNGNPEAFASLLPFYWDWPTGAGGAAPFAGSRTLVDTDPLFNWPHEGNLEISWNGAYASTSVVTFLNDFSGDGTYYWQVQPRYATGGAPIDGAWTGGWSFVRSGFTAQNLQISHNFATPTFFWDRVEGASTYQLQVSASPGFEAALIDISTANTAYTPAVPLVPGNYYWRVRVKRYSSINNGWSDVAQFSLQLPVPTGLNPSGGASILAPGGPTLCWDSLKIEDEGAAVFAAWKYRVQVSRDEDFTDLYDTVDTVNHCWTPMRGYEEGLFYWRVALIDQSGQPGPYSLAASFQKQFSSPNLISPVREHSQQAPVFSWSPVPGAATYRLEVSLYPSFSTLVDAAATINTTYTPISAYPLDRVYYWRVAAMDRDGNMGPFTKSWVLVGEQCFSYLPLIQR